MNAHCMIDLSPCMCVLTLDGNATTNQALYAAVVCVFMCLIDVAEDACLMPLSDRNIYCVCV